jgi:methionyl-tRNA formyltransferase
MINKFTVVFIIPIAGIKPYVVISSLIDSCIDWKKSFLISDKPLNETKLLQLINNHNLNHYITEDLSLKNYIDKIKYATPDFIISCGWGSKISSEIINLSNIASINCHSSYLPDYKGVAVFNHYWANCEDNMGATIHFLTDKFDQGNIIAQQKIKIFNWDSKKSMLWRISEITAVLLREALLLTFVGYKGKVNYGGRYFYKISPLKLKIYRLYNLLAKKFNIDKRLTPHKIVR